ncbi:MAG: cell surface protein SprA [bacterium]
MPKSIVLPILCFSLPAFFHIFECAKAYANPKDAFGLKLSSSYHSFDYSLKSKRKAVWSLHGYIPGSTPNIYNIVQEEVEIESFDSFVVVRHKILDEDIRPPLMMSFEHYRSMVREDRLQRAWSDYAVQHLTDTGEARRGSGGINLDIPVKIKSRAFQKIFGSGSVGLNVTGDISIKAGLRREDRSEVKTIFNQGANTTFKMEQKQRFSVTGKIGDKVTVNVDQDSERAFDFENNVRLNYQGYDDEIIQRIEAGNISLSLPGTRYVTFSGKNSGLFGIKSQMVLGNLNITTIASQEKGESQRISLSGGAEEGARRIKDYQFVRNKYFFLDFQYREEYKNFDADGNHFTSASPIVNFEVYKAAAGYETQFPDENIRAWATLNAQASDTVEVKAGFADIAHFIRLEKDQYYIEPNLGFIRLNSPIAKDEILAVTYTTEDGKVFGDTVNNTIIYKLIKPENPQPRDQTWDLEWKHVYSLGGPNIEKEGFDVKIFFDPPSGPDQETDGSRKWIEIFGLDNKDQNGNPNSPDGQIDYNDPTIVDFFNGELHFPDLRPFDPEGYTRGGQVIDPLSAEKRTRAIYDTTVQSVISQQSKFIIEITTKNRSTNFSLGFNVIEGSEKVILDGDELENGRDYTIDYFTGSLTILDERATNPASQLDISYERNQLFQLEKKTILGMRAEYDLGGNSFLGGTFLYLNETTLDRKVRVGRGPIRNLVWDINTRLNFKPNFIGKAFDILPILRAKGESTLDFEGEIAQVLPTPNTLNNSKTGDNHGVAYIDDFEGAKKTISLGVLRKNWTRASQPDTSLHNYKRLVNYIWYNPFQQVGIKEIYPKREINTNVSNRVDVLTFQLFPDQNLVDPNNPAKPHAGTWGGIMRALSPGVFDQSQTKFIEIMVRATEGRLHIDLGSISEDVIPNEKLDTEDLRAAGGFRNGVLDDGEDVGIDLVAKPDPPQLNFPKDDPAFVNKPQEEVLYDFWDIHNFGIKDADEPWSYDDWFYQERSVIYIQNDGKGSIIGTENNANDQGGRRPDTEDINGNGVLDRSNAYYTYSFSMDTTHADTSLIVGGNPAKGWRLYRIPFDTENDSLQVGSPNPTQIEFVRIWVDEIEDFNTLTFSIAEINMVGSEWKELGTTDDEFNLTSGLVISEDSTVAVTQINTHESTFYFNTLSAIGVEGEEDQVTKVKAREQSLVLKATNLEGRNIGSGRNVGVAQKSLFQGENYIHYDKIKMFVYGRPSSPNDGKHIPSDTLSTTSRIEYFFRFGADVNNYYEYRSPVYEGWHDENHMNIRLQEFTSLDTTTVDSLGNPFRRFGKNKSIRKVGNPSLTNIKTLILGIINNNHLEPFTGELWFNELRLSDVEREKGMAMRFRANMKIANFATINGEVERRDADFHNVAQRFGSGNNSLSTSLNATVNLDNFLPQSWGLAMPLNLNYRNSKSTPKYFPGKDRLVTSDLSTDVLETVQSVRNQNGFNFSFKRQVKSDNFFLKHTLDNLSMNIGRSESSLENPTTNFSNTSSWTGNLDYRLNFGKKNYIRPLAWIPGFWLLSKLKGTKFYYTPQNVSFKVNGSKTQQRSQNRVADITKQDSVKVSETETFNVDRSVRANMRIFESLTVDYSRTHKADMRESSFMDLVKGNVEELNVAQTFTTRYNPKIFSWLNNTFNYSANYTFNNNIQQRTTGRSARVNVSRSADFNLRLQEFARSVFGVGKKSTSQPGRRGRPGSRGRPNPDRGEPGPKKLVLFQPQEKDESSGISLNPLKLVGGLVSKIKDISVNYTERENVSQLGLVPDMPNFDFQLGLSKDTGVATDSTLSSNNATYSLNKSLRASSGIAFGRALDVGLSFQHSEQRNETTTISGSKTDSWLEKFEMPFPEWTVRISGLEKFPLFNKFFRTVTFSHAFSGQRDITWNGSPENDTQKNFTTNFRPLGKLDLNLKNGITANIQMNRSLSLSRSLAGGIGARRTTRSDISVTANYSKRSGFRLPIWPFNKAELKNSIDFSFSFTASSVITEQSKTQPDGTDLFEEADKTERWSVSPRLTYSFSTQVRGGAFIEIGQTNSKRSGKTSVKEFGIDVNIAIRGN